MSKNLLDVLCYEPSDNNDTIVHKHRIDDFNAKSQLIVGESQEALLTILALTKLREALREWQCSLLRTQLPKPL